LPILEGVEKNEALLRYSIDHAQTSILLTTAYFIPSRRLIEILETAERRGVEVKLLVPGKSDIPVASYAGRAFFSRLLRALSDEESGLIALPDRREDRSEGNQYVGAVPLLKEA
jgi:hypothetical protein